MSQNVFADMELPNPEERLLKAELVLIIRDIVNASQLTQSQIAERVGMTQPAISRMLKGMTRDISVEKLLHVGSALGHSVRIIIDPTISESPATTVEYRAADELDAVAA